MKLIYKVLYPLGYEEHEVEEGFPTTLPFVEIKPLESLSDSQSQFFNFTENKWEEAVTQDYSKKLELLENLSTGLQVDNEALKKANEELASKAESLAQINSKTMLTSLQKTKDIATIKEQLEGGE
ncbi:hypothetical protein ACX35N_001542 [Enterococcus faecium]|uniref:hypothetical protein n=1 Tax=Enterococcus TaxID=1350 RepID=UPI0011572FD8|nr:MULTISPECIES: hypothetical protein [Enterococcus]MDQ8314038.1 hypothetical protein [Enterococcus faecium]MDQ8351227.1 hypothetical protein [Enterococcus faecium]MDQ8422741.1 hypothetical protein [Enterococcus faecium]MDQ8506427.1 hypothetical protein [Enterococcus faecium]MDQ8557558.1 hypothetical protein [Enterococcus faecium]